MVRNLNLQIRNKPAKISFRRLKEAVRFYASKLMTIQLARNLNITIEFKENLIKKEKARGETQPQEFSPKKLRDFVIYIDKNQSLRNILLSLAHEFVHVKQYAMNELKSVAEDDRNDVYMNKVYEDNPENDDCYWDSPWEIEAHGRETGLYSRFKKYWQQLNEGTLL